MLPFDLHVLGLPPAFTLSQDQTLHLKLHARRQKLLAAEARTRQRIACKAIDLLLDSKRLQDGQSSFLQASAQVTCAHCQRTSGPASAPFPSARRFRPSEPPIIAGFFFPSIPSRENVAVCICLGRATWARSSEPHMLAVFRLASTPHREVISRRSPESQGFQADAKSSACTKRRTPVTVVTGVRG